MSTNELESIDYTEILLPIHLIIHLRNYAEELGMKIGKLYLTQRCYFKIIQKDGNICNTRQ